MSVNTRYEDAYTGNKRWDTGTIPITADKTSTWGLRPEELSTALRVLKENDLYRNPGQPGESNTGPEQLSFRQFRILISFLHKNGYDTSRIGQALLEHFVPTSNPDTPDADAAKNKPPLIKELQHVLRSFFSPQGSGPFIIIEDGQWGSQAEAALLYVQEAFHLPRVDPSPGLVSKLQVLSGKIVRIHCADEWLLTKVEHNPFCIIDNSKEEYELRHKGNGASIYDSRGDKELVHFLGFAGADKGGVAPFNHFSAWWILLKMGSSTNRPMGSLSLQIFGKWTPVTQLGAKDGPDDFFIKPDYELEVPDRSTKVPIGFFSPDAADYEIIAVLFSGDLRIAIHKGSDVTRGSAEAGLTSQEEGIVVQAEPIYVYTNYDYRDDENREVRFTKKADYLKIFVVRKSFKGDNVDIDRNPFPGIAMPRDFYALLTAREEDILYAVTIGLTFGRENKPAPLRWNGWILVAGSGNATLGIAESLICEALGKTLAMEGYGLMNGGWAGVDTYISQSFDKQIQVDIGSSYGRLKQVMRPDMTPLNAKVGVEWVMTERQWFQYVFNVARAVILIGGGNLTYDIFKQARKVGIPILPIAGTGGSSKRAFKELSTTAQKGDADLVPDGLDAEIDTPAAANRLAAVIISKLQSLPPRSDRFIIGDFKEEVEKVYRDRKVSVGDDLQKGRWGGESMRNGKRLTASVTRSKTPGLYDVELKIELVAKVLLGRVAFFLHNSFIPEIRYVKTTLGGARLKVTAYEAFTVGAYTENRTMLELDLNEVSGFPSGFYYTDISEKFKEEVQKLYQAEPVTVKDDLQKNRWGGLAKNNGKKISATVVQSDIKGEYKVTVEVAFIKGKKAIGNVAFFLHDSFRNEIRYRKGETRAVRISLLAFEAFTVGAYTEDGTLLELDLQREKGYPKGFYYKQLSAK
jgi:hypothetical protein